MIFVNDAISLLTFSFLAFFLKTVEKENARLPK
jgi:hypothetical protein